MPIIGGSLVTEMGLPRPSRQMSKIPVTNRTVPSSVREREGCTAWQEVPQATHTGMAEAEGYDRPGDFCCCGKTRVAECGPREGQLRDMDVKRVRVRPGGA